MLQGSGVLCTLIQRYVAKLDEYGSYCKAGITILPVL